MKIDTELTAKIAHLARLELTAQEVQKFTEQLANVLSYVEQLKEANVEGVEPMTHPFENETPLREDRVQVFETSADGKPKVLNSAPEVLYDGFKVPPILGGD